MTDPNTAPSTWLTVTVTSTPVPGDDAAVATATNTAGICTTSMATYRIAWSARKPAKTAQRCPRVNAKLRRRAATGPIRSTTTAGMAVHQATARTMPGTTSSSIPTMVPSPMSRPVPTTGRLRRNPAPIAWPSPIRFPRSCWNEACVMAPACTIMSRMVASQASRSPTPNPGRSPGDGGAAGGDAANARRKSPTIASPSGAYARMPSRLKRSAFCHQTRKVRTMSPPTWKPSGRAGAGRAGGGRTMSVVGSGWAICASLSGGPVAFSWSQLHLDLVPPVAGLLGGSVVRRDQAALRAQPDRLQLHLRDPSRDQLLFDHGRALRGEVLVVGRGAGRVGVAGGAELEGADPGRVQPLLRVHQRGGEPTDLAVAAGLEEGRVGLEGALV